MSGGREGAVRVWDAAGAEGADVLAALGAGASAQVSANFQFVFFYLILISRWSGWDGQTQIVFWSFLWKVHQISDWDPFSRRRLKLLTPIEISATLICIC